MILKVCDCSVLKLIFSFRELLQEKKITCCNFILDGILIEKLDKILKQKIFGKKG